MSLQNILVVFATIEVLSRQRYRVLWKGIVREDKEDPHSSLGHKPESTRDRYSPKSRRRQEQWRATKSNKEQVGRERT